MPLFFLFFCLSQLTNSFASENDGFEIAHGAFHRGKIIRKYFKVSLTVCLTACEQEEKCVAFSHIVYHYGRLKPSYCFLWSSIVLTKKCRMKFTKCASGRKMVSNLGTTNIDATKPTPPGLTTPQLTTPRANISTGIKCGIHANPMIKLSDYQQFARQHRKFKIIDGIQSHPNGWPWLVRIEQRRNKNLTGLCAGSLIRLSDGLEHTDIIITAAHCVPFLTKVVAGDFSIEDETEPYQQRATVVDHSCANNNDCGYVHAQPYDFALVKLCKPIQFQKGAQPICLPNPGQEPKVDQWCVATGWGAVKYDPDPKERVYRDKPEEVAIRIKDPMLCDQGYDEVDNDTWDFDPEKEICAGHENRSTCSGDSGGPLMCQFDGKKQWVLSGVVAWGASCGQSDEAKNKGMWGVYAKVTFFLDFIRREICRISDYKDELEFCKK